MNNTYLFVLCLLSCIPDEIAPGDSYDLIAAGAICPLNTSTLELRFELVALNDCACGCGGDCSILIPTVRPTISYTAAARLCGPSATGKCALLQSAVLCGAGQTASSWRLNYKDPRICYCECDPAQMCKPYHIDAGSLDIGAAVTVCCTP